MATQTTDTRFPNALAGRGPTTRARSVWELVTMILEPLASLRLTVVLLILGVFVVWVMSLQQTSNDIWKVKNEHMNSPVVEVPFVTFFPPAWFPDLQNIQGVCYLPSGFAVLVAMIVNLVSAHLVRMRVQAKGIRLGLGLFVAAFAGVLVWLVIFGAQNPEGFQATKSTEFYKALWVAVQVGLVGVSFAGAAFAYRAPRERLAERIVFGFIAAGVLSCVVVLFGLGSFIGDSAMRILWQLIQATLVAAIAFVACALLFKRKGAIVLIHLGVLFLMGNELFVSFTNEEQRMLINEGETAFSTINLHKSEMFVSHAAESDEVTITTIDSRLLRGGSNSLLGWLGFRAEKSNVISNDDLPFDIECLQYFPNAAILPLRSADQAKATAGIGKFFEIAEVPATTGTDMQQSVDKPAAYVRLLDKTSGETIGIHALSIAAYHDRELLDTVDVQGTAYNFGLRYKTNYKDYSIYLQDVSREVYPGTQTPRSFASDILVSDPRHSIEDEPKRVWMNNPMRFGNETFYQTNYGQLANGQEYTELQVVRNNGWMIPYVACMLVVLGLMGQFGGTIGDVLAMEKSLKRRPVSLIALATSVVVVLGVSFLYYRSAGAKTELVDMRLDRLGKIPVLYEGRVQPLDSLARNTIRQLHTYESVKMLGDKKTKYPSIRCFADIIFRAPGWEKYQLFKMADLNVLNELGLEPRSGFEYSIEELKPAAETLERLVKDAEKIPTSELTVSQKRLLDLYQKITKVKNFQVAFMNPGATEEFSAVDVRMFIGSKLALDSTLPRIVPAGSDKNDWIGLATAHNRQWLAAKAQKAGAKSSVELANYLVDDYFLPSLDSLLAKEIQEETVRLMLTDPEIAKIVEKFERNGEEQKGSLFETLSKLPPDTLTKFQAQATTKVNASFNENRPAYVARFDSMVQDIGFSSGVSGTILPVANELTQLQSYYIDRDAGKFNSTIERYLASDVAGPGEIWPKQVNLEKVYNQFAPFYVAQLLYIFAFLAAIVGFAVAREPLRQLAFGLTSVGLLVHIVGIVMRVVISGRPPVTSLYSSFIVVSAACVLLLLLIEFFTRLNVANVLATLCGWPLLLYAWTMSIPTGDTFTVLVAVLDTQFWLSTHVICISLGYATTLVAGMIGVSSLVASVFVSWKSETQKMLVKLVYGVTCFGLLFSFFGTVLGGLWADDSWGRFWGWDTKENGALMIVFWNAVLLHARWAGLMRGKGIAAVATLGIAVTFWSWQGVNLLGVGLHNYGFSSEGFIALVGVVGSSVAFACLAFLPDRKSARPLVDS